MRLWLKHCCAAAAALLASTMLCMPLVAFAETETSTVIRVGYPIQEGLTEYDEKNGYSGYTYDYLREIAQYNGWTYEFVRTGDSGEELLTLMEQLMEGKIDVIGGLTYSDSTASVLEFTDESYCTGYTVLAALAEDVNITSTNYRTLPDAKVGTLAQAAVINKTLAKDLKELGMTAKIVTYETEKELLKALQAEELDLIATSSLHDLAGQKLKTVKQFNAKNYFFATTPGNTEVEGSINRVLQSLNSTFYFGQERVAEQHFPSGKTLETAWTAEEETYRKNAAPIRVMVPSNKAPFYFLDQEEQGRGICLDVLAELERTTGLQFLLEQAENGEALTQAVKGGSVKLLAGIPYDTKLSEKQSVWLSHPFLECSMALVTNPKHAEREIEGAPVVAVAKGVDVTGIVALEDYKKADYDSVGDALEALWRGDAVAVLGNYYSVQYYMTHLGYSTLELEKTDVKTMPISFGLTHPADPVLMSILNKGINALEEHVLQEIVYENLDNIPRKLSLRSLMEGYPLYFIGGVVAIAGILVLILLLILRNHRKVAKRGKYAKMRYDTLAKISNEHLFEYDYQNDIMMLPKEIATCLNLPQIKRRWVPYLKSHKNLFGVYTEQILQMIIRKEDVASFDFQWAMDDVSERKWFRLTQAVLRDGTRSVSLIGKIIEVQNEYDEKVALEERALRDSLTGVYNAGACSNRVGQLSGEHCGAVLILDVDYFKEINDTFGHVEGDRVLCALAESLESVFRSQDTIGRLGGDEFFVFMKDAVSRDVVASRCEQLNNSFQQRVREENAKITTTLSIGIYMAEIQEKFESLYLKADKALYQSKNRGRNCYTFYDENDTK